MSEQDSPGSGQGVTGGPLHAVLLGTVARRFYIDGASKVEVAQQLGLSRFKVARLLEEALSGGFVKIEIGSPGDLDLDLSARVAEVLGLRECLVVETTGDSTTRARDRLGAAAAAYVSEVVTERDTLGLPWAREVYAMVRVLSSLDAREVVQLCGAQQLPDEDASAVEVVVQAARIAGGRGHVFYAPLIVDDAEAAATLRRQPSVQAALAQAHRVTRAVVGVGRWGPGTSTIHDAVTPRVQGELGAQGVVGEIAGVFFGADGQIIHPDLERRVVNLGDEGLLSIPHVCGIVLGPAKAPAVRAAIRGGLIDSLVIDAELGRLLLADERRATSLDA